MKRSGDAGPQSLRGEQRVGQRRFVYADAILRLFLFMASQISQRLLGPAPFPLDRVIAILGALLEENDVDTRPLAREFTIPGEYTDMELGRVGIYASVGGFVILPFLIASQFSLTDHGARLNTASPSHLSPRQNRWSTDVQMWCFV